LVLDEPTNDLDLDTLRSLEGFLDDWPGALVVASHDRAFLDRVADHVLAIEPGGTMRRVPGGVAGWLAERASSGSDSSLAGSAATQPPTSASPGPSGASGAASRASKRRTPGRSGPSPSTIGRRLRDTEQAMVKAQGRVDRLTARLADLVDHAELAEVGAELTEAQRELDALEAAWLELAELAEG
ncbi:MAG: ABC transporter ATP-binding protein, partial [Actinomycetota bacterium]